MFMADDGDKPMETVSFTFGKVSAFGAMSSGDEGDPDTTRLRIAIVNTPPVVEGSPVYMTQDRVCQASDDTLWC